MGFDGHRVELAAAVAEDRGVVAGGGDVDAAVLHVEDADEHRDELSVEDLGAELLVHFG